MIITDNIPLFGQSGGQWSYQQYLPFIYFNTDSKAVKFLEGEEQEKQQKQLPGPLDMCHFLRWQDFNFITYITFYFLKYLINI